MASLLVEHAWWILPVCLGVFYLCWTWPRWAVEQSVRNIMGRSPSWRKENARDLRILLDLDGHRMPKRVRDAVVAWLAEHEGDS